MKAIRVTQEIKDKNKSLREHSKIINAKVGDVLRYVTLPNKFHVTKNVAGGYNEATDLHEADGWKLFTVDSFDSRTQYVDRTEIIEEETRFTWLIKNKTQEQIDEYDANILKRDEHSLMIQQRREDGYEYYYEVMSLIERAWRKGQISSDPTVNNELAVIANTYFDDSLEPLLRGNWKKAETNLMVPPQNSNSVLINFYNKVKTKVTQYTSETYSKGK